MEYAVRLVWNSKTSDPFARTTALFWFRGKQHALKDFAERLAEQYGAHSYVI